MSRVLFHLDFEASMLYDGTLPARNDVSLASCAKLYVPSILVCLTFQRSRTMMLTPSPDRFALLRP